MSFVAITHNYDLTFVAKYSIPCGLVARIRGSHPRGPGSIPGTGKPFDAESQNRFFIIRDTYLLVIRTEFSAFFVMTTAFEIRRVYPKYTVAVFEDAS